MCCPRREFQREDIALSYQDAEGDLVRLLSDEDVGLMVKQARGLPSQKRLFPWKLHVTQKDNYTETFRETDVRCKPPGPECLLDRILLSF